MFLPKCFVWLVVASYSPHYTFMFISNANKLICADAHTFSAAFLTLFPVAKRDPMQVFDLPQVTLDGWR